MWRMNRTRLAYSAVTVVGAIAALAAAGLAIGGLGNWALACLAVAVLGLQAAGHLRNRMRIASDRKALLAALNRIGRVERMVSEMVDRAAPPADWGQQLEATELRSRTELAAIRSTLTSLSASVADVQRAAIEARAVANQQRLS